MSLKDIKSRFCKNIYDWLYNHFPHLRKMKAVVIFIPFIFIYIFSMFIAPWFIYSFSWNEVHQVWLDWQTLNTGILALISSLIALYSIKYQHFRSEEKEVQVAKVLLPDSLVELCEYTEKAGKVLMHALNMIRNGQSRNSLGMDIPPKPSSHMDVISTIIRNSDDEYTTSFSIFIKKMQVFNSRLCSLEESFRPDSGGITIEINILDNIILLAELHALICLYFDYARSENIVGISSLINRDRINGSLLALDIDIDDFPNLRKMLDRRRPE